jgi:hypothetical protein
LYDRAVAFSPESFARLLCRHPQKLRVRRRILAVRRRGTPSHLPEASRKELHGLCLEVAGLEPRLAGFLEQHVPSRAAADRLRARWRRVREANAVQLAFVEAWERGGIVDAEHMQEVAEAITEECRELRIFARDLAPRLRPPLALVRLGGGGASAARGLTGTAIPVRVDRERRCGVELAYRHVAWFDSWQSALAYRGLYRSYVRALEEDCGLDLPWGAARIVPRPGRGFEVYVASERLPESWVAAGAVRHLPVPAAEALARSLFEEIAKVWRRRATPGDGGVHVAVSGRLDHWAIEGLDAEAPEFSGDERLVYLAAHRPLLRRGGKALLDPHILTQRIPWPVSAAVGPLVRSALVRQHQLRHVLIDSIASFERRAAVQESLVALANELIEKEFGRWVDRTIHPDDVREHQRQHDHLCRLLGSLDRVGGVLEGWRRGHDPSLLDAAHDLYGILTKPRQWA